MGVTALDILLVFLMIIICIRAVMQKLVRQLMGVGTFYLATVAAGLAYPYGATFLKAIGGSTPTLTQTIVFWILFVAVNIALGTMLRRGFPDVSLPKLGWLDNALALLPGILCAFIAASLMLTSIGHAADRHWGILEALRPIFSQGYEQSALRSLLGHFLSFYLIIHRIWFPIPPPLLAYILP